MLKECLILENEVFASIHEPKVDLYDIGQLEAASRTAASKLRRIALTPVHSCHRGENGDGMPFESSSST